MNAGHSHPFVSRNETAMVEIAAFGTAQLQDLLDHPDNGNRVDRLHHLTGQHEPHLQPIGERLPLFYICSTFPRWNT